MPTNLAELIDALSGGEPKAYDRRFKIPIHINPNLENNELANFKVNNGKLSPTNLPERGARIHLNPQIAPSWRENDERGQNVVKHELIHALQNLMFSAGKYKSFQANLDTSESGLFSALKNWFKPDPLENIKNRIWKLAHEPSIKAAGGWTTGIGDADMPRSTSAMSDWVPWFLTDTLPKGINEKFSDNEKKLVRQYFTDEFMRLAPDNLKKYRSIWE